jgi:pimeloyl-ACP methyl ester carboxylesterase
VPVVFLTHLAAVLDNWDPGVVDGIAARHPVITFDNRCVGASSGSTPTTIEEMAREAFTFIRARGFDRVKLFGFSTGGMVAQVIAQEEPQLVRKMIFAGTRPAGGRRDRQGDPHLLPRHRARTAHPPGPQAVPLHQDAERAPSEEGVPGTVAGSYQRPRQGDLLGSFRAQLKAVHRWGQQSPADLASIHQPVLAMNGESDRMVPTKNTVELDRRLPDSQLVHRARRPIRRY